MLCFAQICVERKILENLRNKKFFSLKKIEIFREQILLLFSFKIIKV